MSGSVDDEIVRMRFDNNAFERAVSVTLNTIVKLKNALKFNGAAQGLQEIENKASGIRFAGMGNAVDGISKKFLALSTVAITAISNITNRAISAGGRMVKSLTIDPILSGYHEYETQLGSIQTILANTGLKGKSGLAQVNGALNELNTYSDKTIYNFTEMAKNIGTFTAAGVKLKPATSAIKGIANLAALSGSTADQASTAMYQLSQAIANNKVGLQDWNSVVNAGMGGKVFQEALFNTAKLQKTIKGVGANETFDQWTKSGNSFRDSLKSGWITGKVLTSTLSQFTGDLTDAQLKSMGYNKAQIKEIQERAKTAGDAATKVKTLSQLMDTLKEAVGSGWAKTFQLLFGDFGEAKKLFTSVSNVLGGVIQKSANARNSVLKDFKKLGGRTDLIKGISNAFHALTAILKPVKQAFREIFPAKTGKDLAAMAERFKEFTKSLKIGPETADKLKRSFAGLFAIFDIGKQIIGGIFHVIASLFGELGKGSGGFLSVTASVGDMIVAFDKALKSGDVLHNFFRIIGNVLAVPIKLFGLLGTAIGQMFKKFHPSDAAGMTHSLDGVGGVLERIAKVTENFGNTISDFAPKVRQAMSKVADVFSNFGEAVSNALSSDGFSNVLRVIQTGLLGGIVILLKKFFSNGLSVDIGGGFLGKVGEAVEGVTGNLKAMQQQLKAKALLEIAAAIGILALSLTLLAAIKPKKLQSALQAMAIGFAQLLVTMQLLTKISSSAGFVKMPLLAASLNLLATAILILATAVALLSRLSWEELKKGLTAVGLLLGGLVVTSLILSKNSVGMVAAGVGITAMAVAINLLYVAVKLFSMMSWGEMLKGLAGVGIALVGIAIAMRAMPKGILAQSAALLLVATAVNALYLAVKNFSSLNWQQMAKGLAGVAGSLTAIALGLKLMPKNIFAQSIALNAVATAMLILNKALTQMAKLSWKQLAKGLTGLAGSLIIMAVALKAMTGTLPGSAALLVMAVALRVFVPALVALAKLSLKQIAIGLGAIAASFAVLGISAAVLGPLVPAMFAFGVALGVVGLAMLAVGAGAALLGVGLTAVAASGGAAIGVLIGAIKKIVDMFPTIGTNLAKALVNFVTILGKHAPGMIASFAKILKAFLQAIIDSLPKIAELTLKLINTMLKVILEAAPKIADAAFKLLLAFLKKLTANLPKLVKAGSDMVIAFLKGLGQNIGRIIDAAARFIVKLLNGIADAIDKHLPEILKAGGRIAINLIKGLGNGLWDAVKGLWHIVSDAFQSFLDSVKSFLGINSPSTVFYQIGVYLIQGLANGVKETIKHIFDGFNFKLNPFSGIDDPLNEKFGIHSPSTVFHEKGKFLIQGLANGIRATVPLAQSSMEKVAEAIKASAEFGSLSDIQPTVTPVLDLTQFRKDAAQMNNITTPNKVATAFSYRQASTLSANQLAAAGQSANAGEPTVITKEIKFEQTNISPKPLSNREIYLQTKNQLSMAKGALGVN